MPILTPSARRSHVGHTLARKFWFDLSLALCGLLFALAACVAGGVRRDDVVLACISKRYFAAGLRETGAHPLVWTTNLREPTLSQ